MNNIKKIWFCILFVVCIMCFGTIINYALTNTQDYALAEEKYKLMVYGININPWSGETNQSIESSILTAIYEDGVYTLGEANLENPKPRYNLDYYYQNGEYTYYYVVDTNGNQIPVYLNSSNYYYTTSQPSAAYFYNNFYSITYNLNGGVNSEENYNYFPANAGYLTLHAPTRDGYKFLGWYYDSSFTQYVSKINKANVTANITLYAKWSPYVNLPVKYITTDHYLYNNQTVGHINAYYNDYVYYYEDLDSVSSMVSGHSDYSIYTSSGNEITYGYFETSYYSSSSYGEPSYILIDADPFYSVNHVLNGGSLNDGESLYNYYYTRPDLASDPVSPHYDGYVFMGWFLDSSLTTTIYTSSFVPSNITLYAKWAKLYQITASFSHTDFFTASTDYVDTIDYYFDGYDYIYSSNIEELNSKHEGYTYEIRTADDSIINHYAYEDKIKSIASAGTPAYIRYNTKEIYTITYELAGGYIDPEAPLYNYYNERVDLKGNTNVPLNDTKVFTGWYLDAEYTSTVYDSSFVPHNMTLYAKWADKMYAPVYYYDSSLDTPDYVNVGTTYYYIDEYNGYNLGYFPDTSKQIPYFFNKYDATSYKVYSKDNEEMHVFSLDGKLYTSATAEIGYIRIYKHYSIRFYVNGNYVDEARGAESDKVEFPNYITGFIGENYDAAHIGIIRIGKEYALYVMKGWSLTDSSDITWFYQTEVELVSEDITFSDISNGEYVINLYGYMTYYGKLNSMNSDINYDNYIDSTNGIITLGSLYSLDDLMQEHVTEISSDSQKTNIDKILKYFKLDSIGSTALDIIKKIINGNGVSLSDLWSSTFGKIFLITSILAILVLAVINIINFVKAMSKIQSKS